MSTSALTSKNDAAIADHPVVSREAWIAARKALLEKEKEATRLLDEVAEARRELPWVKVEKEYVFDTTEGKKTLAELFDGRSQLIVYHFMFGPGWAEGCPGCSFLSDHIDGPNQHLVHHDVTLMAVSRAPLAEILPFKKRMGWRFNWASSFGSDFNYDYHVSFTPKEGEKEEVVYNFERTKGYGEEMPGLSVFYKDADGEIFHTYSAYARGLDALLGAHGFLDRTPKGRNEGATMNWVRHHDKYEPTAGSESTCCSRKEH